MLLAEERLPDLVEQSPLDREFRAIRLREAIEPGLDVATDHKAPGRLGRSERLRHGDPHRWVVRRSEFTAFSDRGVTRFLEASLEVGEGPRVHQRTSDRAATLTTRLSQRQTETHHCNSGDVAITRG